MNKEEIAKLRSAIELDLNNHVYDKFPTIKVRLESVVRKLIRQQLVINADALNGQEVKLLQENEYMVVRDSNYFRNKSSRRRN